MQWDLIHGTAIRLKQAEAPIDAEVWDWANTGLQSISNRRA